MNPLLLALALFAPGPADAGRAAHVCYPGGPVKAQQARPAIARMLRVLERMTALPADSFEEGFDRDPAKCREAMKARRPALTILSLGLYLEHREAHQLTPLVRPRFKGKTSDILRIVVKKGGPASLADLKGKTLGGTPLAEPEYLARVVFPEGVDPRTHFTLKPSRRPLRALREVAAGTLDAVLLTDVQYASLEALPFAAELAVAHTFPARPLVGVIVDGSQVSAAEQAALTKALAELCADAEGKEMCTLFGVDAFEPVDAAVYEEAVKRWGAR